MIACDCHVCRSKDSRDKRSRASIYVETPEMAWVVDTGPDFREQCLRERVRRLDAVLYTHAHSDHVMGFDDLRRFCAPARELPVYAGPETMADLVRIFEFAFNGENRFPGYVLPLPRVVEGPFELGGTLVTPLPVGHGRAKVNGYLFERNGRRLAAYLSDCKEVSDAVVQRMAGVEALIVDALRHRPHPTHMNITEALALVERARPRRTWFTHICHEVSHAEAQAQLPEGVVIAHDGLEIVL